MTKFYNIYLFTTILIILDISKAWFMCGLPSWLQTLLGVVNVCSFLAIRTRNKVNNNSRMLFVVILLLSPIFGYRTFLHYVVPILYMCPFISISFLDDYTLEKVKKDVTKWFCILICISLIMYFLHSFGVWLPSFSTSEVGGLPIIANHGLYIQVPYSGILAGAFSSCFIEPGYCSIFCVCLCFLLDFDIKDKRMWVLIAAIGLSMSLGGYLLVVMGFCLHYFAHNYKHGFKIVITAFLVIIIVYYLLMWLYQLNGGNNVIVEEILSRLEFDSDKGIAGNNRENAVAEVIIDKFFTQSTIWLGIGSERWVKEAYLIDGFDACSWRIFVVKYGILYTCTAIMVIFKYIRKIVKPQIYLPFVCIYFLDFLQHANLFTEVLFFLMLYVLSNKIIYNGSENYQLTQIP